jgi:hypothetical protein
MSLFELIVGESALGLLGVVGIVMLIRMTLQIRKAPDP